MIRLQIVGGGRMGEALLGGLIAGGWAEPSELAVVERFEERRAQLAELFPGVSVWSEVGVAEGAVVAVKPPDVAEACKELGSAGVDRVLSIAAGISTQALEAALGEEVAVVRAMPNTPALVGAGAAAVAPGASATTSDVDWAISVLSAVGVVVQVTEPQLDAVTGLSGSGPAYVFLVAESLMNAGAKEGLPRDVVEVLVKQTLLGSAKLLAESDDDAVALRAAVTSPGGTTAAGIERLEADGLRAALLSAVEAATERSRELGRS